jgi:hypothetical protein
LRPDQVERVDAGIQKGFRLLAGDIVTIVNGDSDIDVTCIMYDLETGEGLTVDAAGIRSDVIREILILTTDISDFNFSPECHFIIDGERWDLVSGDPIMSAVVPIGGLHNMTICWVTRATEIEKTDTEGTWGWNNNG